MDLQRIEKLVSGLRAEYISEAKGERESRRWLQDFRREIQEIKHYRGREILELMQNADDAGSEFMSIRLDTSGKKLVISNSGAGTKPFTEEGIESIMYANMSPKRGPQYIGAKGLGFRSVLNWASRVEIRSAGLNILFNPDIVERFWREEMAPSIEQRELYEAEAGREKRRVPLSILALPEIRELAKGEKESTSIVLIYQAEEENAIIEDLRSFTPESMLFLHNIRRVSIQIEDETEKVFSVEKEGEEGPYTFYFLNGKRWVVSSEKGIENTESGEMFYEAACAFCLDGENKAGVIYSFFPTRVEFELPCVLHASLELNSSRNSLIEKSAVNEAMMERLAKQVSLVSTYLKGKRCSWDAYKLMRPSSKSSNPYCRKLFLMLSDMPGKYIPLVNGTYADADECYYFNDEIYDFVNRQTHVPCVFGQMRLNDAEGIFHENCGEGWKHKELIEAFAFSLSQQETFAEFIILLMAYLKKNDRRIECNIFRNANNEVIRGKTYVNGGDKIEEIPEFFSFEYLNEELEEALKEKMKLPDKHPEMEREMAQQLSNLGDISASDITSVTNNLLLKKKDENLAPEKKHAVMRCLFRNFILRGELSFSGVKVYLEAADGSWQAAENLVLSDRRFPDGFDNLGFGYSLPAKECVKTPEYLLPMCDGDYGTLQHFLEAMGVRLYYVPRAVDFAWDRIYIDSLPVPEDVKRRCTNNGNISEVLPVELVNALDTESLLRLLIKSGYDAELKGPQKIKWYYKIPKPSVEVPISYAAYYLRNYTRLSCLKYYCVDEGMFLPGFEVDDIIPRNPDPDETALLVRLGAKKNMASFSAEELYDAVNRMAEIWERAKDARNIQTFYHNVKKALENNPHAGSLPYDVHLKMLCTDRGEFRIYDSREIFYSDNYSLPSDIARSLPVLYMRSREGESSVKNYFGCRTFREIVYTVLSTTENRELNSALRKHLETCKPYILAAVSEKVGSRGGRTEEIINIQAAKELSGLDICVITDARYICSLSRDKAEEFSMAEDELLLSGDKVLLCSRLKTLADALENPGFPDAIIEAICITLRLKVSEWTDRFHRILKASDRELSYMRTREISPHIWNACERAFGVSISDIEFWTHVFDFNAIAFDVEKYKEEKRNYIKETLGISYELTVHENFVQYHLARLKELRNGYTCEYIWLKHRQHSPNRELQRKFRASYQGFIADDWLETMLEMPELRWALNPDYESFILAEMKKIFDFVPEGVKATELPRRHDEYMKGLKFEDDEILSLLYFDGNEDFFEKLTEESRECAQENNPTDSGPDIADGDTRICIMALDDVSAPVLKRGGKSRNVKTDRKSRVSEQRKRELGEKAERKVFDALIQDDRFEVLHIYSEFLNPETGSDSKGYDIEYRRKDLEDALPRFLEIKYSDGESFIISQNELNVALQNKTRYDIALVVGEEIMMLPAAFEDEGKYRKVKADYTIRVSPQRKNSVQDELPEN